VVSGPPVLFPPSDIPPVASLPQSWRTAAGNSGSQRKGLQQAGKDHKPREDLECVIEGNCH